jgi:hypothetical protein
MRPSRAHSHHPLAAAGSALEHLVLRHFGLQLIPTQTKESPRRSRRRPGAPTRRQSVSHDDWTI